MGLKTIRVENLANLAESFAIPKVVFNPRYMCFPTNHPMHVGFSPDPFLDKADVILVVDSDVPWYPSIKQPQEQCKVIQIGIDPFYQNYPIRSFPCDLAIQSDSSVAIPLLAEALSDHIKKIQDRITKRYQHVYTLHKEQRNAWRQALEKVCHSSPLDPLWVSHCINRVKDENTIIFNEYDLQKSGRMIKKCPAMAANLSHRFRLKSLCESYEEETIKDFSFRHK